MIPRSFFERDPVTCAQELIGCELVWGQCAGIIVETEAYAVVNDEACHTFLRPIVRKFIADHAAGFAYVYLNYGMYWLLNVLVKGGCTDGFVLIRAIEPTRGVPLMQKRRGLGQTLGKARKIEALCSGPGKLTIALSVNDRDHGRDLCRVPQLGFRGAATAVNWRSAPRIGISRAKGHPWRFLATGNRFVSHYRRVEK